LICDLCNQERTHVVRVNNWTVCRECSADGPLQTALEAYHVVVRLRKTVKSTAAVSTEDKALQRFAEQRVRVAQSELEIAINALIPAVAKSAEAKLKALQALEQSHAFEDTHPYLKDDLESEP
jgi:hypothetical protein